MSTLKINGQVVAEGNKRDVERRLREHYKTLSPDMITPYQRKPYSTVFMQDGKNSRIQTDNWGNELVIQH